MRIRTLFVGLIVAGGWMGAAATPAAAQTATTATTADVSVGYQFLMIFGDSNIGTDNEYFKRGWNAAVTVHLTPIVAAVGEVSGDYSTAPLTNGGTGTDRIHTFAGGLRGVGDVSSDVSAFIQVMIGGVRITSADGVSTGTGLALQPGIGFDVRMASRFGVRMQGDYLYSRFGGQGADGSALVFNGLRVVGSLVINLSAR